MICSVLRSSFLVTALAGVLSSSSAVHANAVPRRIELVSVNAAGQGGDESSRSPAVSADGRYIAYLSGASNLDGASPAIGGIFVRDRQKRTTERVSVDAAGNAMTGISGGPSISADGRFVVFEARSGALEAGAVLDIFVRDRQLKTTTRISFDKPGDRGSYGAVMSGDGRFIAYWSHTDTAVSPNGRLDVLLYGVVDKTTAFANVSDDLRRVSSAFDPDYQLAINYDGSVIAFDFGPTNIVAPATNPSGGVIVRDRVAGSTELASVSLTGQPQTRGYFDRVSLSRDGRFVAFNSQEDLTPDDHNGYPDVYVRDRERGTTQRVSLDLAGKEFEDVYAGSPSISGDGRFVLFRADDVYVRDTVLQITHRLVVNASGEPSNGSQFEASFSADSNWVTFVSTATNLVSNRTLGADGFDVLIKGTASLNGIRIETPNDPSRWGVNSRQRLAWTYAGTARDFQIDVTRDGGTTWEPVQNVPNRDGESQNFWWIVTGPSASAARLRVTAVGDAGATDVNDADIVIAPAAIEMLEPSRTTAIAYGRIETIFFKHNLGIANIAVDVSGDNGASWRTLASTVTRGATTSSFRWNVDVPPTRAARVRVRAVDGTGATATSAAFTVTPGKPGTQ